MAVEMPCKIRIATIIGAFTDRPDKMEDSVKIKIAAEKTHGV